jgi:carbonic anhydrase/acetyltransferase-like protein (isoleucine patch superfamily)
MLIAHAGKQPEIDPSAWVAPDATVCGDVLFGAGTRILHGARLIGEGRSVIRIGRDCVVMENAVVRASRRHPCKIGDHCLIGSNAHVAGALVGEQVFIATGAAIFHGADLGMKSEVGVHAIVHLRTRLEPGAIVPIGWVAVGNPAQILPPDKHDEIWAAAKPPNFPEWVYGFDRLTPDLMVHITRHVCETLEPHSSDIAVPS